MRLATCRRFQESQALMENPTTTQNEVARMTAFNSVDTDRRFNMMLPQSCGHLGRKGYILRPAFAAVYYGGFETIWNFRESLGFPRRNRASPATLTSHQQRISRSFQGAPHACQRTRHVS